MLVKDRPQKVNMKEYAKALGFKNVIVMTYLEDLFHDIFLGNVAGVVTNTAEVISLNPYRVDEERK